MRRSVAAWAMAMSVGREVDVVDEGVVMGRLLRFEIFVSTLCRLRVKTLF